MITSLRCGRVEWHVCMVLLSLLSCTFEEEPGSCPYNVRLEYWYAGTGNVNILRDYVDQLQLYLFDSKGVLLQTSSLHGVDKAFSTLNLPPGDYRVVCWGNMTTRSSTNLLHYGISRLEELRLSSFEPVSYAGFGENTEPLYFGSEEFTVVVGKLTRRRVYISHCHARLRIQVRWLNGVPEADGLFRMRLREVPSEYEFVVNTELSAPDNAGRYVIPRIGSRVTNIEAVAAMNYSREVMGELVSYRYTNSTHPLFCLYRDGVPILPELDLWRFFRKLPVDMEHNVQQEFNLLITVDGKQINVSEVSGSDWEEGGSIG